MLIFGHRGAAGLADENTIRSFQTAESHSVHMLECDLRQTKDGQIVLSHDANLERTHGHKVKLKNLTLAQVKQITLKSGKEIPELSEFLSTVNLPINLDIKENGFEAQVVQAIGRFANKVLITSWNPYILKKIRALDENIDLGPIVGRKYKFFLPIVISILKTTNISSITIDVALVNEKTMNTIKNLGWKAYVYTNDNAEIFNDPEVYRRLKNLGVDGIFTDYPNIVSKLI